MHNIILYTIAGVVVIAGSTLTFFMIKQLWEDHKRDTMKLGAKINER